MTDPKFLLILVAVALIAFSLSFALVPQLIKLAVRNQWYDMPEARRVHKKPLPRIGGLAIFAGFAVATIAALLVNFFDPIWQPSDMWRIILTLVGATIVTGVMLYDDLFHLSAWPKLLVQAGAALLVTVPHILNSSPAATLISEFRNPINGDKLTLGPVWAVIFTVFWIAGMMNTVNYVDGLDGLAGGVVCISALVLVVENFTSQRDNPLQFTSSVLALALAAAILGFLPFNWHPSKIIMGDCGAQTLGYLLGIISIIDGAKLAAVLLLVGLPVLDTAWVMLVRIYRGHAPQHADRTHLHHRLLDLGFTQRQIVLFFYLVTIIFGAVGILIPQYPWAKFIALLVLALLLMPVLIYAMIRSERKAAHSTPEE